MIYDTDRIISSNDYYVCGCGYYVRWYGYVVWWYVLWRDMVWDMIASGIDCKMGKCEEWWQVRMKTELEMDIDLVYGMHGNGWKWKWKDTEWVNGKNGKRWKGGIWGMQKDDKRNRERIDWLSVWYHIYCTYLLHHFFNMHL